MAVELKTIEKVYEADTEKEVQELLKNYIEKGNLIKTNTTYKYLKKEDREFYLVSVKVYPDNNE